MMELLFTRFAAACGSGGLFGFPTWYKYLGSRTDAAGKCIPAITGISDIWLIVAAIIDMLLRVAALAAIAMIVYGGIQFITSQGESEQTAKARNTVINAVIGLVISISAAAVITFVAGRFTKS